MRQFTVSGIFSSGYYEYDASLAFINYQDAAKVFRDSGTSGVRLRIADMQQAPLVARQLSQALPPFVQAQDWTQNNRTRSEEHTSELQSLIRISYAVF